MADAIVMRENGGPDVLRIEPVEIGTPGAGELRVRQTAIGVNFHDVYVRSGLYQTLALPGIPGIEAAGIVEEVGHGVTDFAAGDHVILHRQEDFAARIREITDGRGVDVACDSVGKDTFQGSLASLATFGHLVNFGQASGSVALFDVSLLARGSQSVTRPIVFHYLADRTRLEEMASALFGALAEAVLTAEPGQAYPLREAATAHRALEARQAPGPLLLVP